MKAYLILEDGTVFEGAGIGSKKELISEIVFNTSMTGYTEILTDPSYAGQAVVMTYPLIGNYGVCFDDCEAKKPWPDAFIVRELSRVPSNFRSDGDIDTFLKDNDIPGIAGIDTRALTKLLRNKGTMNGLITYESANVADKEKVLNNIKEYRVKDVVKKVSRTDIKKYYAGAGDLTGQDAAGNANCDIPAKWNVAVLDVGTKYNIIRCLLDRGCNVTVYPQDTKAEVILADNPDGIMITNGPGDPKECVEVIGQIKKLYDSSIPIFAICLGHQLMALAAGADTKKMKYGHRGANHPVKDTDTNRVYISSQNHGYVVDEESLDKNVAVPAFVNVNDGTIEGLKYIGKNILTVQFHPEACSGPRDSEMLFGRFIKMMEENEYAKD